MTVSLGVELRTSLCELINDRASSGFLILYGNLDSHTGQLTEEIVRFGLANEPFYNIAAGSMVAHPVNPARCTRAGTLRYWAICSSPLHPTYPDQVLLHGDIGDINNPGSADLLLDSVMVEQNQAIAIASFTYSAPL